MEGLEQKDAQKGKEKRFDYCCYDTKEGVSPADGVHAEITLYSSDDDGGHPPVQGGSGGWGNLTQLTLTSSMPMSLINPFAQVLLDLEGRQFQ